ncbi:MAG: helix-turn-helix domain-containing protein [Aureliella sp.]
MTESFRGGNSRLLARQLDQLSWPIVVLDQRCEIVFISAALCQLLQTDATRLVGLACKPELTKDDAPERELSMALAPPSQVLHGQAAIRQVPWPPKNPTGSAAQAFIPLIDEDPSQGLILVLFGQPDVLRKRLQPLAPPQPPRSAAADEVLLRLRSQWQQLDGMWPLLGVSPAAQLAMRRAQLAVQTSAGVFIHGPAGSGKAEIARMLYAQRARGLDVPASVVQALPIDCAVADEHMVASALETLAGRLRPGAPPTATHLLLERIDCASEPALRVIEGWLAEHGSALCVVATSEATPEHLAQRGATMSRLIHSVGTLEIALPPLGSRREDVAALAQHCLAAAAQRAGRRLPGIAKATMDLLEAYSWPGNAFELRQAAGEMLANAVLTATIQPAHLPLPIRTFGGTLSGGKQPALEAISLDEVLLDLERIMLERAIKLSPRNRARAARLLGISRPRFLRRIAQLGLDERALPDEEE